MLKKRILSAAIAAAVLALSLVTPTAVSANTAATPESYFIDFDKYSVNSVSSGGNGNTRNEAGTYSVITDDSTAFAGSYLQFKKDKTGNHNAYYMFVLNEEGAHYHADKDKAIMLNPEKQYKVTVRYKITDIGESQKFQFRLYNTTAGNYDVVNREDSTHTLVFGDTGNKTDWTIASGVVSVPAPEDAQDNYGLVGYLAPTATMGEITSDATNIEDWTSAIDYISIEEVKSDYYMIDFDRYVVNSVGSSGNGNTRSDGGTYSVAADETASAGKYLQFTSNGCGEIDAHYMFILNREGVHTAANKSEAIMLDPAKKYRVTVRYKITGIADDKTFQFRLSTTTKDHYDIVNRSNVTADRALVFGDTGPKNEWTIASGVVSVPAPTGADNNYSLIASFAPTQYISTEDATQVVDTTANWSTAIDYIKIEEASEDVIIDFDKYTIDSKSNRTEAGTFSIENDSECDDGKYLQFVDNSTTAGTHIAHHMFQANMTGDMSSPSVTKLEPGVKYDVTIRYKLTGLDSAYKLGFWFYNSGTYSVTDWSNDGTNNVQVTNQLLNTEEWTQKKFTFTAPTKGSDDKYSLLAAFAPFKDSSVNAAATYTLSLDFIKITKYIEPPVENPPVVDPENLKVNFDDFYDIKSDVTVRSMFLGYCSIASDPTCDDGKYLNINYPSGNSDVNNRVHHAFQINHTGGNTAETVTKLPAEQNYRLRIRYKVANKPDNSKLYFRLYNSGSYLLSEWSNGGENSLIISSNIQNTDGWITEEYAIVSPKNNGSNYTLFGTFEPWNENGTAYADIAYNVAIDYIELVKVDDTSATQPKIGDSVKYLSENCSEKFSYETVKAKNEGNTSTTTSYMSARTYYNVLGDVNMDGNPCEIRDLVALKENTLNTEVTDGNKNVSDIDGNGSLEDTDLLEVKKAILSNVYKNKEDMRLIITNPHPGIPGYDAEYEFIAEWKNGNTAHIPTSQIILECNYEDVIIEENKVTVPASLKDNNDLSDLVITAYYKNKNGLTGKSSLPIVKWQSTFSDDFTGETIDRTKWTDHNTIWHTTYDLKDEASSQNIRVDDKCYIEDGNLVMPIVANTENKSYTLKGSTFTPDYISAELRTDNTFHQNMGCFTVKMKGPASNTVTSGSNNAFWLMPKGASWGDVVFYDYDDGPYKGYACGEIDIVERSAAWEGKWYNTHHVFDTATGEHIAGDAVIPTNDELKTGDWMEYTSVWLEDAIYTYANGKLVRADRNITTRDTDAYMILSNNLRSLNPDDGQWVGAADKDKLDELTVYVDYVKAYSAAE